MFEVLLKDINKTVEILDSSLPNLCLEIAGGGYSEQETARAMEIHRDALDGLYEDNRFRIERK